MFWRRGGQDVPPKSGGRRLAAWARRRPLVSVFLAALIFFAADVGRYLVWPPLSPLAENNPAVTTFMEHRERQWRRAGRSVTVQWNWKELKRISPNLRRAVVAAEDSQFWKHEGFDWKAIRQAFDRNWAEGRLAVGGSTITQQLAKNLYFTPDKSVVRKLQEAIIAWRLEKTLSKERILELYLNVVEWGEGVYGAEAAARHHFQTSAAELTPRQAATLAALLPNPLGRTIGSRRVENVTNIILRRMR